jgi:ABC-type phosphate transport system substrate-binding protein
MSLCLPTAGYAMRAQLVVVVNKESNIQSLTKKEIVDIYMGRYQSFPNGSPALPIDFPAQTEIKSDFYAKLVNLSENKIQSYWSRLLFSGRAQPPKILDNSQQIVELLSENNAAIAYIPEQYVTEEMKIVYQL